MPTQTETQTDPSAFVTLALLLRPQGRRGELLADLFTDFPGQLAPGTSVFLVPATAAAPAPTSERIAIESQWMPTGRNAGRIVLKLAGTESISDAERIAGSRLMVPATERPPLEEDTFFVSDLVGSTLFNGDTRVGEVVDLEFATTADGRTRLPDAAPLLCVRLADAPEDADDVMIPFVRAHLRTVDTATRRIVMDLPAGLLELGA